MIGDVMIVISSVYMEQCPFNICDRFARVCFSFAQSLLLNH